MPSQKPKCTFLAANKIIQQLIQKTKKILKKNSCGAGALVVSCSPGISVAAGPENTDQQGGTVKSHQRLSKQATSLPSSKTEIKN